MNLPRRSFITILGGAAATWPARGQQVVPVVGILASRTRQETDAQLVRLREGLESLGFAEGRNVTFEYRMADNHPERLPVLAANLVENQVALIVALQGSAPPIAAKAATTTIPIVFASGGDPVKLGLVSSLNRPGKNVTGVSFLLNALSPKRLELLHELAPSTKPIGFLGNPANPSWQSESRDVQSAAHAMGLELVILTATNQAAIEAAFTNFAAQHIGALMTAADQFFDSRHEQIVALAARHVMPAIYHLRDFADSGGLMSYGTSVDDAHRLAGTYVGRILKGEKPADLPVQQSVKVELIINMKTAKTLGVTFPLTLLGRADEVIE